MGMFRDSGSKHFGTTQNVLNVPFQELIHCDVSGHFKVFLNMGIKEFHIIGTVLP